MRTLDLGYWDENCFFCGSNAHYSKDCPNRPVTPPKAEPKKIKSTPDQRERSRVSKLEKKVSALTTRVNKLLKDKKASRA